MSEEIDELREAASVVDQADAVVDLIYFALGTLVEMGVDGETVFDVVHSANMLKFAGTLVTASDGKVEKPEEWVSPEGAIRDAIALRTTGIKLVTGTTTIEAMAALAETLVNASGYELDPQQVTAMRSVPHQSTAQWRSPKEPLLSVGVRHALREIPYTDLTEDTFHLVIDSYLTKHRCIGVIFDPAIAYGNDDPPYSEAASIVQRIESGVFVLDHGPTSPGLQRVNIDRLYQGIRSASGSLWIPD